MCELTHHGGIPNIQAIGIISVGASSIGYLLLLLLLPPPPHELMRKAKGSLDRPPGVLVLLGRKEALHVVAAKCTLSPHILSALDQITRAC